MAKRSGISSFLVYPFILIILINLFAAGNIVGTTTGVSFASQGSLTFNQCKAVNGTYSITCLLNIVNSVDCSKFTGVAQGDCTQTKFNCNFLRDVNVCTSFITYFGEKSTSLSLIPSINPLTDPLKFLSVIFIVMAVILGVGIAVFGTSLLNAGTAYILFITVTLTLLWLSLLNGASPIFNTFPCYSIKTQALSTCLNTTSVVDVEGNVNTGLLIETLMTLFVALGIIDTVAL